MFLNSIYQIIGEIVVIAIIILIISFIFILILEKLYVWKKIIYFSNITIFIIDLLYSPIKKLRRLFKLDETFIDKISIEIRNNANAKKFNEISPKETLVIVPHCLRNRECPATLQKEGMKCIECGKCSIGVLKRKIEDKGYKLYIVPGSSFVKKIIKENSFKSVLGIACFEDLNKTMMMLSDYNPQGVLLKSTGCFETKVDIKEVLEKLKKD